MSYNIVLIEPEIPNNTGNIGRLSLASGCNLHLVKPFGFELSDSRVKRAGLDYWRYVSLTIYEDVGEFFTKHSDKKMVFFSSRATQDYWSIAYEDNMFFVFGKESTGLSPDIIKERPNDLFKIPILSPRVRSLNLANAVSVVVYEALRNLS